MYEGDDLDTLEDENPPEESGNRAFLIVAAILGGIVFLSIACLAVYGLYVLPRQKQAAVNQQNTLVAQNLQVNEALTQKAVSDALSQTPAATATLESTATPLIPPSTTTPEAATDTPDPQTATVAAALTQAAQAQLTVTAMPTTTQLPNTGFFDDAGAPGLFVMALALVVVILLARRLRTSPTK
ncbi:MAG: hypothetical protein DYG87_07550 [Anaerolineae bacterium CFX3]|nr:hypothetical protein [Anaerolineae bacterium CFX3]MCQ3946919.1 hypothetical protein [Anaerolineae bacterium]RIK26996.1 MAG: hypothetical protein DCC54_04985 [Anaerolineae bacterium]